MGLENIIINGLIAVFCGLIPTLITLWLNEKVKGSVKNSFDQKIEGLKKEHSKEISQFQAELNYLKASEKFKFEKLHEKRLEVLAKTYELLIRNLVLLESYTSPLKFTPKDKDFNDYEVEFSIKYREIHNKFLSYFNRHAIYFSVDIEELILSYISSSAKIFDTYDLKLRYPKSEPQILNEAYTAYKKIPEIIYPLKKEIEKKFRLLLGDESVL